MPINLKKSNEVQSKYSIKWTFQQKMHSRISLTRRAQIGPFWIRYLSFRTTMLVYNLARKKKSLKKHGIYILNIYKNSNDTRILINLSRFGSGHFLDDWYPGNPGYVIRSSVMEEKYVINNLMYQKRQQCLHCDVYIYIAVSFTLNLNWGMNLTLVF